MTRLLVLGGDGDGGGYEAVRGIEGFIAALVIDGNVVEHVKILGINGR